MDRHKTPPCHDNKTIGYEGAICEISTEASYSTSIHCNNSLYFTQPVPACQGWNSRKLSLHKPYRLTEITQSLKTPLNPVSERGENPCKAIAV